MATVTLAVQTLARAGITPSYTASGASPLLNIADTFRFQNDGKVLLHFKKTGAGDCTVTIQTPETVDGLAVSDRTVTVPATTGDVMIGPFPPNHYNQAGGNYCQFTVNEVTGLSVAIVKLP